ncbi:MAG TPA: 2-C-methyl-D-erythritol 4-phosphate cytidylyltransferase [Rubrobacteraceae bacterium]|nr:2-C-methyl-D-erythritol 4-phosphate cytidylyltransferase [Rubrobacteraceae bacterium]
MLAGGTGSRMGRPKQYIELLGVPALLYALHAFEKAPEVTRIYVVGDRGGVESLVEEVDISKYSGCASPGETRSLSTRSGLSLIANLGPETLVLVHDGSRCLVTSSLVGRVVAAMRVSGTDGVIPALPISDTVKVAKSGTVLKTLDRTKLYTVQTPQAFRLGLLRRAYAGPEERLRAATDDASLIEEAGGRVLVVEGEKTNIKLTTPEDLILAEAILRTRYGVREGA